MASSDVYTFEKRNMKLRIRVTHGEPYFMKSDINAAIGCAREIMAELYPPENPKMPDRWIGYTAMIDTFDRAERGGDGRKKLNAIYQTRVDILRRWIEWEVIPQLSKIIYG